MARYTDRINGASIVSLAFALHAKEAKKAKGETPPASTETKQRKRETKPQLAHPKDNPERSEPYLRLVALRPCEHCGRSGPNQAAHVPPRAKQMKESDLETFSLCPDQGRRRGCHTQFDNYKLGDQAWTLKQGLRWAAETRSALLASGQLTPKLEALVRAYKPARNRK
jgi:hypothetical protein